ncbi:hypothetical protein TUM4261_18140 [Shewanella sp. c952]|uniref:hypothetical protein n=1 Tax=Shewanella sp. c952 TaxID=2815913 RepID=UPI001BBB8F72|nr:hypothetical protein [Shewanella sp. c952]GIU09585.1 hypothetical protein TUM4261_18140 [Shewanella sp. c952]
MLNLKTVFVIALLSASTTVSADEITVDTTDLEATLTANLAESMDLMQVQLTEELNTMLVADELQEETATKTVQLAD